MSYYNDIDYITESKLDSDDRNKLSDDEFGIPDERKYPLIDKEHLLSAVSYFDKAPFGKRSILAQNIIKRAIELKVDYSNWNNILKYCGDIENANESYINIPDRFQESSFMSDYINNECSNVNDEFGKDNNTDCQNEYNTKDAETLNKLIASEQSAIDEYLKANKETTDMNLRTLYADIGSEERFHAEELMYAKSVLTGEKYEPRDPEVKKEYEDLIEGGADEEDALMTVISKHNISNALDRTDDNIGYNTLKKDADVLESAINVTIDNINMIETICEFQNPSDELSDATNTFIESYMYMEDVDNVSSKSRMPDKIKSNPIKLIIKGFTMIYKYALKLIDTLKIFLRKRKLKRMKQREWFKTHSIKDLFASGIKMYFVSDVNFKNIQLAPIQYMILLDDLTKKIATEAGLRYAITSWHDYPQSFQLPREKVIKYRNLNEGIRIIKGTVLTKSKIVINDKNESDALLYFFGYTKNDKLENVKSNNIYNSLEFVSNTMTIWSKNANNVLSALNDLAGNVNSIYYSNRTMYNQYVDDMKTVINSYNQFIKALAHDLNTLIKLNEGTLEETMSHDEHDNPGVNDAYDNYVSYRMNPPSNNNNNNNQANVNYPDYKPL